MIVKVELKSVTAFTPFQMIYFSSLKFKAAVCQFDWIVVFFSFWSSHHFLWLSKDACHLKYCHSTYRQWGKGCRERKRESVCVCVCVCVCVFVYVYKRERKEEMRLLFYPLTSKAKKRVYWNLTKTMPVYFIMIINSKLSIAWRGQLHLVKYIAKIK